MEILHIYAQDAWHDEAYIAGTREALKLLRDAIDSAIEKGTGSAECFVCDGEGYRIEVVVATKEQIGNMVVPYTSECAKGDAESVKFGPWTLLSSNQP